jgi:hypothetical protein
MWKMSVMALLLWMMPGMDRPTSAMFWRSEAWVLIRKRGQCCRRQCYTHSHALVLEVRARFNQPGLNPIQKRSIMLESWSRDLCVPNGIGGRSRCCTAWASYVFQKPTSYFYYTSRKTVRTCDGRVSVMAWFNRLIHCITLPYITLQYTTLYTLHYTKIPPSVLNPTLYILHYNTLHDIT